MWDKIQQLPENNRSRIYLPLWYEGSVSTHSVAGAASGRPASALSLSLSLTHTRTHTHRPAAHRFVSLLALSLGSLRASTCAGIHVPTFCAHSIGWRPGGGACHWLTPPASGCLTRRWLAGGPGTHGPAHSCVARVCGVGAGAALLQRAGVNTRTRARTTAPGREMHNMFYASSDRHNIYGPAPSNSLPKHKSTRTLNAPENRNLTQPSSPHRAGLWFIK